MTWQWHTSQGCPDGVEKVAKPDIETVYMEPRALAFLRAWPDVPPALHGVWDRLWAGGVLWSDPNVDDPEVGGFPFHLRLTEAGLWLKDLANGQSYNMFLRKDVMGLLELVEAEAYRGTNLLGHDNGMTREQESAYRMCRFQELWKDDLGGWSPAANGYMSALRRGPGFREKLAANRAAHERLAKALKKQKLV